MVMQLAHKVPKHFTEKSTDANRAKPSYRPAATTPYKVVSPTCAHLQHPLQHCKPICIHLQHPLTALQAPLQTIATPLYSTASPLATCCNTPYSTANSSVADFNTLLQHYKPTCNQSQHPSTTLQTYLQTVTTPSYSTVNPYAESRFILPYMPNFPYRQVHFIKQNINQ